MLGLGAVAASTDDDVSRRPTFGSPRTSKKVEMQHCPILVVFLKSVLLGKSGLDQRRARTEVHSSVLEDSVGWKALLEQGADAKKGSFSITEGSSAGIQVAILRRSNGVVGDSMTCSRYRRPPYRRCPVPRWAFW